jgi:ribosomal protein L14E/L6E/L27E
LIKISLEVREGAVLSRVAVQAESIGRAVSIVKGRYPGREVRIVFPIDSEEFFIEGPKKLRPDESRQPLHGSFTKV